MNIAVLRNLSRRIRNHLILHLNSDVRPIPLMPSSSLFVSWTRCSLRFYSSESDSPREENFDPTQKRHGGVEDVDGVSNQELKRQIEKYYKGDEEAIPAIFEAILKRKLSGIGDDEDDKLMEEVRRKSPSEDFDSESDELR
ncbi:uncharacterized protein LOC110629912 [Manihot esculenta]|uniref:Uncharacterized protein n=1 Tax=Manihot esculenta TaxID=3983 RepID=A0A2C9WGS2_MANES|nr:uncharacterized protein LOC110629912 [Manihot esculenta]OAY59230.1 hypothetical protein MANES_01G015200v8 [Manihot esculenta]